MFKLGLELAKLGIWLSEVNVAHRASLNSLNKIYCLFG